MSFLQMAAAIAVLFAVAVLATVWGLPLGLRLRSFRFAAAGFAALAGASVIGLLATLVKSPSTSLELWLFRFDGLAFFSLVVLNVIAFAVYRYSLNYLAGDPNHTKFLETMVRTIAATLLFVLSNHLILSGVLWIAVSFGMHRLLRHFDARPAARRAANKKFWFSRVGDACFWSGTALLAASGISLQPSEWSSVELLPHAPTAAAVLITAAVLFKSAQFPFHTWLPETMEAPTPVSALMHAGVVNAGAFLLLRSTALLAVAPLALDLILAVGGLTAAVGCLVWWTQTDTKKSLAWSTIAQMGFLMVEIGLGLYHVALLHLLGHALYKAHSFLRSGTLPVRSSSPPESSAATNAIAIFFGLLLLDVFVLVRSGIAGHGRDSEIAMAALWTLIALEVARRVSGSTLLRLVTMTLTFSGFATVHGVSHLLFQSWFTEAPSLSERGAFSLLAAATSTGALTLVSAWLIAPPRFRRSEFAHALHVHTLNGFYLGTLATLAHERIKNAINPKERHA